MFFFKWPLEYKSQFPIDLEKKILVSKYTFSGPTITQKAIKNTLNFFFYLNGGHFSKLLPEYACFNISVSN